MRLIKRIRNGKSVLGTIDKAIGHTAEIVKKTTIDRDKVFQLEHELQKIRAGLLLSGAGSSITKITICGLVSLVVGIGAYMFLTEPKTMEHFKDFALAVTPLIGVLIGVYGTGKAFKNSKLSKD